MSIPYYLVAVFAVLSIISISVVRGMPWRMRLSLAIPRFFIFIIYILPIPSADRVSLVRGGLIAMFIVESVVSLMAHLHRKRTIWNLET